jgi:pyruvate/2-oxoglutarate dehydrogenase complex dihydrolipoamide dehydrogenase (E3) component
MVESFRSGSQKLVDGTENLDLIRGEGKFIHSKTIEIALNEGGSRRLTSETIAVNVGTRPSIPPIDGLDDVTYYDNATIMELGEVPDHLVIVGGGYIGMEFAQMYRRFGAEVTVIESEEQILPQEDPDIAGKVAEIMTEDGVTIHLSARAKSVRKGKKDWVAVTIEKQDGSTEEVDGCHLLFAVGRKSNIDIINADAAGLKVDENGILEVNDRLETNVAGIYAIGEIAGSAAFTHISYDDYRILEANILHEGDKSRKDRCVPYTVFIDPQLGRVGMNERSARQKGQNYKVASLPMTSVARALETGETRGIMKVLVDPDSKLILGAAILGIDGGEIMSLLQIAIMGKVPYTVIRDAPLAHPTTAESLNNLFARLGDG